MKHRQCPLSVHVVVVIVNSITVQTCTREGGRVMAATASELRRIYTNLFGAPDRPEGLHDLQRALESLDRSMPTSRQAADRLLRILNGGADPALTFTQLECLRAVLSARAFAPLMPTADQSPQAAADLITLYKNLFAEPDLAHLRALQQAVFDYD